MLTVLQLYKAQQTSPQALFSACVFFSHSLFPPKIERVFNASHFFLFFRRILLETSSITHRYLFGQLQSPPTEVAFFFCFFRRSTRAKGAASQYVLERLF